ncbi:hypothetical protein [Halarcobacter anaerophilus]|uniref:Uncharacterized protein n=1 Tax=Halarcobacter anaerophilus TaxID=877500 RepID=A0A4Q0XYG0_9BACT|nr:hypothetical protein [Halarcobacter anaerophilus]QDF29698.1 hypothetical protein AANAER_2239 [Halarcobacter anaerophilus]RXJ62622.1 hypothetical protein CRV06_09140 [Halarcobacter anaerophilus]
MKEKILFVTSIPNQAKRFWDRKEYENIVEAISQYELENIDLKEYKAIIFSMYIDQYILCNIGNKLKEFLENGKKIFLNGHIIKPFFKELKTFIPMKRPTLEEFKIIKLQEHLVYKNIDIEKLNKRKGVAGFFSRGGNPAPKGAEHIIAVKQKEVIVDWEYRINNGSLYVHSGNDLWTCMEKEEDNYALFNNIINWIQGDKDE